MKRVSLFLLLILMIMGAKANDGAFYSVGNHLIPISDSDIRAQKEILTITRVTDTAYWGSRFEVNVYYEFFNPGKAKDIIVGFEAPSCDAHVAYGSLSDNYAKHPYIYDFKVVMNGENLPYQLAHVPYRYEGNYQFDYSRYFEDYFKDGQMQDMTMEQYQAAMDSIFPDEDEEEYFDWYGYLFYYVYHFNAHFNEGLNIIQHTYAFDGSALVGMDYIFDYILTAANRWANNGIDDFTLIVDMGERETFLCGIDGVGNDEWTYSGKGKNGEFGRHVQSGALVLHKENFHPEGELKIGKRSASFEEPSLDLIKERYVMIGDENGPDFKTLEVTKEEKQILKNLPFAYRGYVFKKKPLWEFFESTDWYVPNPGYKPSRDTTLSDAEKEWIRFFSR